MLTKREWSKLVSQMDWDIAIIALEHIYLLSEAECLVRFFGADVPFDFASNCQTYVDEMCADIREARELMAVPYEDADITSVGVIIGTLLDTCKKMASEISSALKGDEFGDGGDSSDNDETHEQLQIMFDQLKACYSILKQGVDGIAVDDWAVYAW